MPETHNTGDVPEDPEELCWSDRLSDIRARIEERTPEYLARFDDLAYLRGQLLDCIELIDASVEGGDTGDLFLGAVFDAFTLDHTRAIMHTLPTVPGDVSKYIRREGTLVAGLIDDPEFLPEGNAQ